MILQSFVLNDDLFVQFVMWGDPVNAWVKFYKKSIPPRRNSYFTCMTGV